MSNVPYSVSVAVADGKDFQDQLSCAVNAAIEQAVNYAGPGILVTRHDHQNVTVQLTDEVPFGTTLERDLRRLQPNISHQPQAFGHA